MAFTGSEALMPHPKFFAKRTYPGMKFSNQEFLAGSHQLKRHPPIGAPVCLKAYDWLVVRQGPDVYIMRRRRSRDRTHPPKPIRLVYLYPYSQGLAGKPPGHDQSFLKNLIGRLQLALPF